MAKFQDETKDSSLQTETNMTIITELNENDCLCGKERNCVNHPGSRKFRATIDEYASKYNDAVTKQEKMAVTKEIYDSLRSENGRFLKYDNKAKGWIELSSLLARDKISHALRFANRDTNKVASESPTKGHRRGGSETSAGSQSTYTTVASQLSFDELEDVTMDDEPLNWEAEGGEEVEQPYVYEVSYESEQPVGPPPTAPYYHGYGPYHPPYPYPHYGYPHYGHHYRHYYPAEQAPSSYPATAPAPAPRPAVVQRDVSTMSSFPEKPLPEAPARKSSMDVDLSYLVNEPLMDWDTKTEEVFVFHSI